MGGTSVSSAIVAGVAALVKSANPWLSNKQLRDRLLDKAATPNGYLAEDRCGAGVIDAAAAVDTMPEPEPLSVSISGPTTMYVIDSRTWYADVEGGSEPHGYLWYRRTQDAQGGWGNWEYVGNASSYQYSSGWNCETFELRLEVHSYDSQLAEDTVQVAVVGEEQGVGPCVPAPVWCEGDAPEQVCGETWWEAAQQGEGMFVALQETQAAGLFEYLEYNTIVYDEEGGIVAERGDYCYNCTYLGPHSNPPTVDPEEDGCLRAITYVTAWFGEEAGYIQFATGKLLDGEWCVPVDPEGGGQRGVIPAVSGAER